MKKTHSLLIAALFVAAMPIAAIAQNHGGHGGHSGHGQPAQEMQGGHEEMIMLGAKVVDGVRAEAHLNDVAQAMAKAGMKETHHFMVTFRDVNTGNSIETGSVALKIKGPGNMEAGPVVLVGMDGHFGADIVLVEKGHYELTVGTRLSDGKTRQFEFMHML
jgi:hypothetical protein